MRIRSFSTRILLCAALVAQSTSSNSLSKTPAFVSQACFPYLSTSSSSLAMSNEVKKAEEAALLAADGSPPTIFDNIISGKWDSDKLHEDDLCMAFRDVNPQAPDHFLVIPKNRDGLTQLSKACEDQKALLGHLMYVAQELGQKECPKGFCVTINNGKDGAQSVYHLHLHVMGGRQMQWPPG